jgi:glucans biosynthesis protein
MRKMDRRGFVASLAGAGVMIASGAAVSQTPPPSNGATRFGFDDVVRRARDLATAPLAPSPAIPDALARLDNDAARDIKFRSERAFLAGADSRFRLQTIHLDPRSSRPVTVSLIRDGIATPIPYSANLFDYGRAKFERPLPLNLGFAGFRLRYPINDPRGFDDAVVFTGSSQFRFLGRGQRAGASLRALSVNAGLETEEFPFFREFWIEAPEANARHATIYALLDGESVTGAFQFQIEPGVDSVLTVGATLFPRRVGGVFGFAPVVSMYLAGEGDRRLGGDYRPEAHSSDALALHTGAGERVWRPLRNPARAARFSFLDNNPRGFGLVQRDRSFDHYQDLEAGYEARASYWVEPTGANRASQSTSPGA